MTNEVPDNKVVSALLVEMHGEYNLLAMLNRIKIDHYFSAHQVFDGSVLDQFMEEKAFCDMFHKLVNAYPKSEREWRDNDFLPLVHAYVITTTKKGHTIAVKTMVSQMIEHLPNVVGDDDYFDYFPNTVEDVLLYAESVGLRHLIKPLYEAIFADNSPYMLDGDQDAYQLFPPTIIPKE